VCTKQSSIETSSSIASNRQSNRHHFIQHDRWSGSRTIAPYQVGEFKIWRFDNFKRKVQDPCVHSKRVTNEENLSRNAWQTSHWIVVEQMFPIRRVNDHCWHSKIGSMAFGSIVHVLSHASESNQQSLGSVQVVWHPIPCICALWTAQRATTIRIRFTNIFAVSCISRTVFDTIGIETKNAWNACRVRIALHVCGCRVWECRRRTLSLWLENEFASSRRIAVHAHGLAVSREKSTRSVWCFWQQSVDEIRRSSQFTTCTARKEWQIHHCCVYRSIWCNWLRNCTSGERTDAIGDWSHSFLIFPINCFCFFFFYGKILSYTLNRTFCVFFFVLNLLRLDGCLHICRLKRNQRCDSVFFFKKRKYCHHFTSRFVFVVFFVFANQIVANMFELLHYRFCVR